MMLVVHRGAHVRDEYAEFSPSRYVARPSLSSMKDVTRRPPPKAESHEISTKANFRSHKATALSEAASTDTSKRVCKPHGA